MKWISMVVVVVAVATAAVRAVSSTPFSSDEQVPIFGRTLQDLHRGPPEVPIKTRATVTTHTIEQKVDNFNNADTRTWQMRYMLNDEHFKEGGPMFIYLGGEWTISPGSISGGHFYDLAKEHGAMLFYTEHRYYGQSRPTSDLNVDNLDYLHVKQALADVAHFIEFQRSNNATLANSKVVIAGCSYSATMVVWFKRLYPHLVNGGWASSAPILAKVDFREYKEVVGKAIRELGSERCYNRIQNGIAGLELMFASKRGAEVKSMLKLCNNFDENNDLDMWSLFGSISNIFSGIVQYQREGDVGEICDELMAYNDDVIAMANFVLMAYGGSSGGCVDATYKSTVAYYRDSSFIYGASRPWYYQTCNEYGWYQTSGSANQPFGTKFPVTLYTTLCADIYGHHFTNEFIGNKAAQTNKDFGGMSPAVQNVYMTHGGLDPWSPMGNGLLQGANVIPRASHCADTQSISDLDSDEMRTSKQRLAELVREWLA